MRSNASFRMMSLVGRFNCQTAARAGLARFAQRQASSCPWLSDGGRVVLRFLPRARGPGGVVPRKTSEGAERRVAHLDFPRRRSVACVRRGRTRPTALHCGDFSPRPGAVSVVQRMGRVSVPDPGGLRRLSSAAVPPLGGPLIVGADGCPGRPGRKLAKHPRRRRVPLRSNQTPPVDALGERDSVVGRLAW